MFKKGENIYGKYRKLLLNGKDQTGCGGNLNI